jgi:hypothetical protein
LSSIAKFTLGSLAGRPELSNLRKDGRSQRCALANNLAANAADMVKAGHGGTMMFWAGTVKARSAPAKASKLWVKQVLTVLPAF